MKGWQNILLKSAGFGGGFALIVISAIGVWSWYKNRPPKQKPWDAKAIVATFDYADKESADPSGETAPKFDSIVAYYTLENTTDTDYHMPTTDLLEIDGRLKHEKSLSGGGGTLVVIDTDHIFIPAKQRRRFAVYLHYPLEENVDGDAKERKKLVAAYIVKQFSNLDGFVIFDNPNRYQINLPNGWETYATK